MSSSPPPAPSVTTWGVGMVLVRATRDLQAESYSQELIAGLDQAISSAGGTFLLKVVPDEESERETYRQWAASGHIQSVVTEELTVSDTRRELLESLGFQITVLGDVDLAGDWPVIWNDHAAAVDLAVRSLYDLGHRNIGRVSGPIRFHHSRARSEAFFRIGATLEIRVSEALGDYSVRSGGIATRELISNDTATSAIIFDNDLMALGGLAEIQAQGLHVPNDVSIVAWDDSVRCQMSIPPLSALSHDVREIGQIAGEAADQARSGVRVRVEAPRPILVLRGSVGPPSREA